MLNKIINRHGPCLGLKLWKWNNFLIELWYCPAGYKIAKHSHDNVDIELTYLFGEAEFIRVTSPDWANGNTNYDSYDIFPASLKYFGKTFTIKAGTVHWFEVSKWPLVFINREYWKTKPTSASEDFTLTTTTIKD